MTIKEFFKSKAVKWVIGIIGGLIILGIVFQAGMFFGFHKAGFSYKWGEDYYKTFGKRERNEKIFQGGMMNRDFLESHGTIGKIVKISLPTIVIEGQDNVEKVILIKDDTTVRELRKDVKSSDLKVDDTIVVIGAPNAQSQIEAKLIRIIPSPPAPTAPVATPTSPTTK